MPADGGLFDASAVAIAARRSVRLVDEERLYKSTKSTVPAIVVFRPSIENASRCGYRIGRRWLASESVPFSGAERGHDAHLVVDNDRLPIIACLTWFPSNALPTRSTKFNCEIH